MNVGIWKKSYSEDGGDVMRLFFTLSFAAALSGAGTTLLAQHAGGGHSSGAHGSFSSGFHSQSSAPASHSIYPVVSVPVGGATGINPGALPTGPYRTGVYRNGPFRPIGGGVYRGGRYAYGYYPFYPLFDDYDNYGYYNGGYQGYQDYPASDPATQTANLTANMLGEQVQRLSAEVEALRDQREQDYSVPMPRQRYNAPPLMPEDQTPSSAPLTLMLRDGKRLQINSYAVMGQEIWDFSSQPVKKIALANVDLAASHKATEAGGGEFPEIR